jgi:putative inorganic carbon (HCO3(-)) transporter
VSAVNPPFRQDLAKPGGQTGVTRLVTLVAVFLAAGTAALSGLAMDSGSKMLIVLPLAAAVAVAMAVLALTRFSAYVALMLVLRSALDVFKLSGSSAGSTATNSTSARGLDPSSLLAVLFLLMAALWLAAQHRRQGGLPTPTWTRRAVLWFVAAAALSVLGSANMQSSALELLRVFATVMMFVVLEQLLADRSAVKRILVAIYCAMLFPLLYTAYGLASGSARTDLKGGYTRIAGTFQSSNDFGRFLMFMLIMAAAIYPHLNRRWRKLLFLLMIPSYAFLMLTYTRTALLGTVFGLIVVGIMQSKRLLLTLAVVAVCAVVAVPSLSSRFSSLGNSASAPGTVGPSGNSLAWRLSYWSEVLPLANSNPVTGIGINMTQYNTDAAKQPHNDFVRAYVEMGLLGFGAYVTMLISLLALGRRAARAGPRGTLDRGIGVGFLGCAVAFVAVSAAANVMSNVVTLWYLFAFAAAASAVVRLNPSNGNAPAAANLVNGTEGTVRGNQ